MFISDGIPSTETNYYVIGNKKTVKKMKHENVA
jgi:hypothetical protein